MKTNIILKLAILLVFGMIWNISAAVTDREKSRLQMKAVKQVASKNAYSEFDDKPVMRRTGYDVVSRDAVGKDGEHGKDAVGEDAVGEDGVGYGGVGYDDAGYDDAGYDDRGYDDRGYDDRGYDDRGYYDEEGAYNRKKNNWTTSFTPANLVRSLTNLPGYKTVSDLNKVGLRTTGDMVKTTGEVANIGFGLAKSIQEPVKYLSESLTSSIPFLGIITRMVNDEMESALEYAKQRTDKNTKDIRESLKKTSKRF